MCIALLVRTIAPTITAPSDLRILDPRTPATPTKSITCTLPKSVYPQLKQNKAFTHSLKNIGGYTPKCFLPEFCPCLRLGGGVGWGRQLGDADDDFALFGALEFFAGDAFDFVGIGLEGFDLIAEMDVFGVEAVNVFAHALDFELCVAHGDEAVGSENVVHDEGEDEKAEHGTAVLLKKITDLSFYRLIHGARTHFVASSVNFADAFALSASM